MAKLFAFLVLFAFIAVAHATVAITSYSDSNCTDATGHFQSNEVCMMQKRSGFSCLMSNSGAYYQYDECTDTLAAATTQVPSDWQSFMYSATLTCNFTDGSQLVAVAKTDVVTMMVINIESGPFAVNVTAVCTNGLMDLESCNPAGCSHFNGMPSSQCRNVTTSDFDQQISGIQTTCTSSSAPSDEPMSAPSSDTPSSIPSASSSPSANTPSNVPAKAPGKSSEAASVLVASALVATATAALLC